MTALVQLLPAILLMGSALVYLLPLPIANRSRALIPIFALALAAASVAILARTQPGPVTLFEASDVLPALTLTLQWDGAALPLTILIALLLSGRLLKGLGEDGRAMTCGALVVTGGAFLFLAADNWTTVAAAWLVVELGLLIVPADDNPDRDRAALAFGWNLAAVVAWLTAGLVVTNEGSSLRLEQVTLSGTALLLVFLAIWIRSGLYPFQSAAPTNDAALGVRLGLPLLLAGYLLTRMLLSTTAPMRGNDIIQIVALLGVGASALLVVGQPHGVESLIWVTRAMGAPLLILPFLVSAQVAPPLSLWLGIGVFAASVLISVAVRWRAELPRLRLTALVWIAVLVVVAMLPLSPAFWSRAGLLEVSYAQGRLAVWLLLVATMALLLIPLWREVFASREVAPKTPSKFDYAALACLLVPTLLAGLAPFVFVGAFGPRVQEGLATAYDAVLRPANTAALIFLLAGLGVPLLASFELARRWDRRATLVPARIAKVLELSGVSHALDLVYRFVRALVQQGLALLEQPPIAWLIFLAIWVAVWLSGL